MRACRPWLEQEIALVRPRLIVALGATAAQSLAGHPVKVTEARGSVIAAEWPARLFVTVHPSAILRIPDRAEHARAYEQFVKDLEKASRLADA